MADKCKRHYGVSTSTRICFSLSDTLILTGKACVPNHKNPHRRKIIYGMLPIERKDDLKMFFVEYPVYVICVAVILRCILVFFVLYIGLLLTSVSCTKEIWSLSPDKLSGYIKA